MKKSELLNVNVNGNKKLVNNDQVRWLIWNLPAVTTCPNATELCINSCYALKAERLYPNVKASRLKNHVSAIKADFAFRMIDTITYYRNSKSFEGKLMLVRIHESGDFFSQEYVDKWVKVINHFRDDNTIKFICYTKSLPFFENVDVCSMKNLSLLASVWDDTPDEMLNLIRKNDYRVYTAVSSFEGTTYSQCRCSDCAHCMKCANNNVKTIACKIH